MSLLQSIRKPIQCAGLVATALGATAAISPAAVVVRSTSHEVYAYAGSPGEDARNASGSAFGSVSIADGAAVASSTVLQNVFAITLEAAHNRPGKAGSLASSYLLINFDVDADAQFRLDGEYAINDALNAQPGHSFLNIYLQDVTANAYLYSAYIESESLADPTFRLGSTSNAGTTAYDVFGSLGGALVAGHSYQLLVNTSTDAFPNADNGATAAMRVVLQVPEPSVVLTAAVGLVFTLRRSRRINP